MSTKSKLLIKSADEHRKMGSTNNYTKIMHLKEELLNTVKLPYNFSFLINILDVNHLFIKALCILYITLFSE